MTADISFLEVCPNDQIIISQKIRISMQYENTI
jgi:hypothetical protein